MTTDLNTLITIMQDILGPSQIIISHLLTQIILKIGGGTHGKLTNKNIRITRIITFEKIHTNHKKPIQKRRKTNRVN